MTECHLPYTYKLLYATSDWFRGGRSRTYDNSILINRQCACAQTIPIVLNDFYLNLPFYKSAY